MNNYLGQSGGRWLEGGVGGGDVIIDDDVISGQHRGRRCDRVLAAAGRRVFTLGPVEGHQAPPTDGQHPQVARRRRRRLSRRQEAPLFRRLMKSIMNELNEL